MVTTVQAAFCNGTLGDNSTCKTVVLTPKGDGRDFHEIGLVEVLWKNAMGLLKRCFTSDIYFHAVIHGFRAGHRMVTTTLEDKLLQQLTNTMEAVLYVIFLDLQKEYDTLDRD